MSWLSKSYSVGSRHLCFNDICKHDQWALCIDNRDVKSCCPRNIILEAGIGEWPLKARGDIFPYRQGKVKERNLKFARQTSLAHCSRNLFTLYTTYIFCILIRLLVHLIANRSEKLLGTCKT